jgi:hypothetical protein
MGPMLFRQQARRFAFKQEIPARIAPRRDNRDSPNEVT